MFFLEGSREKVRPQLYSAKKGQRRRVKGEKTENTSFCSPLSENCRLISTANATSLVYNTYEVVFGMDLVNFGLRLSRLRDAKGVSARDMSISIGKSPNYINKIERGKTRPSMDVFYAICKYLGISQQDFFEEENNTPKRYSEYVADLMLLDDTTQTHVTGIVKELGRNR